MELLKNLFVEKIEASNTFEQVKIYRPISQPTESLTFQIKRQFIYHEVLEWQHKMGSGQPECNIHNICLVTCRGDTKNNNPVKNNRISVLY